MMVRYMSIKTNDVCDVNRHYRRFGGDSQEANCCRHEPAGRDRAGGTQVCLE